MRKIVGARERTASRRAVPCDLISSLPLQMKGVRLGYGHARRSVSEMALDSWHLTDLYRRPQEEFNIFDPRGRNGAESLKQSRSITRESEDKIEAITKCALTT